MFYFGNYDRKKIITVLLVIMLISLMMSGDFKVVLLTLPGVIIAMTFHEFAHAWMADRLGDTTPRAQGRLTLNPASHIDPIGIFFLLFVNIGWGRPVEINPSNFNSNKSMDTCEALVSLAGPLINFILAFIFMIITYALSLYTNISTLWLLVFQYIVIVNIGLGVFNLIPIYPLDGSKIFRNMLPYNFRNWIDNKSEIIYFIFMVLWISGLLSKIVSPVIGTVFDGMNFAVAKIFSLF